MTLEPVEGRHPERLGILVRSLVDREADLVARAHGLVDLAGLLVDVDDAVEGENVVLVRVQDHERAWSDQGSDEWKIPPEGVDHEHAIAMPFNAPIGNVVLHRGDPRDRSGDLDALVERRDPEGVGPAAGASRDPEFRFVDLGTGLEVIEGADAVPRLDSGGGVAARVPPPAAELVGAVVFALDLAELEGVENETGVAVFRKPVAVVLVGRLVAVADPVDLHSAVTADVEDRRERTLLLHGTVEVGGDIETGFGLEDDFLHDHSVALDRAGDLGFQVRARREGLEPQHFKELATHFRLGGGPVGDVLEEGRIARGEAPGLAVEVIREDAVALGRLRRDGSVVGGSERDGRQEQDEKSGAERHDHRIANAAIPSQAKTGRKDGDGLARRASTSPRLWRVSSGCHRK